MFAEQRLQSLAAATGDTLTVALTDEDIALYLFRLMTELLSRYILSTLCFCHRTPISGKRRFGG